MLKFRSVMAALAGASLVVTMAACGNPSGGSNAAAKDVGPEIKNSKVESVAAMVPAEIRDAGKLTIAINPDVAPIKFVNPEGEIIGLNPELLEAAGVVMGLDVEWQKVSFDALVPGLQSQRFDVIASIGDFKERQGQIDFIDYMTTGSALIVSADFEKDSMVIEDTCGLRISVGRGTYQQGQLDKISEDCVAAGKEAVKVSVLGDTNAALLAVKSDQADGFWGDVQALRYNAKTSPELYKVTTENVAGPYGIGINKKDVELRDALRAGLLHLVENGTYDQLLEKWGQESLGMPELPLNSGGSLKAS